MTDRVEHRRIGRIVVITRSDGRFGLFGHRCLCVGFRELFHFGLGEFITVRVRIVIGGFADPRQASGDRIAFALADGLEKRVDRVVRPVRAGIGEKGRDAAVHSGLRSRDVRGRGVVLFGVLCGGAIGAGHRFGYRLNRLRTFWLLDFFSDNG